MHHMQTGSPAASKWQLPLLFSALYWGQGSLSSYISFFQKPYLAGQGVQPEALGLLTVLVSLPFVVKVFFGILTDRWQIGRFGSRLPWIMLGIVVAAAAFLGAATVEPARQLFLYTLLVAGMVFAIALADTATDAMAVETIPPSRRAGIQAAMTGSRAFGAMVASVLVGLIVTRQGYGALMPTMALMALLPLPVLLWLAPRGTTTARPPLIRLSRFLDSRRLVFAGYALIMSVGLSGTIGLVTFFMHSRLGAGSEAIGGYGALVSIGTLIGAAAYAGWRRWSGVVSTTVMGQTALAVLSLLLSVQQSVPGVVYLGIIVGTIYGFVLTGVLEMTMDRSDVAFAGTSFALLMSVFNVGGSLGDGFATAATGDYSFPAIFQVLASISLFSILPLLWAHRLQLNNALDSAAPAFARPVRGGGIE